MCALNSNGKASAGNARHMLEFEKPLAQAEQQILELEARRVLATDPYVQDDTLVPLKTVLDECDLFVVATPHKQYAELALTKPVVDIWNIINGERGSSDRGAS